MDTFKYYRRKYGLRIAVSLETVFGIKILDECKREKRRPAILVNGCWFDRGKPIHEKGSLCFIWSLRDGFCCLAKCKEGFTSSGYHSFDVVKSDFKLINQQPQSDR